MFVTAFCFCLRIGEYTADRAGHNLMQLCPERVTLTFQSLKHSGVVDPLFHYVHATHTQYCPVKSLLEYVAVRGRESGPLFLFNSKPFSSRRFSDIFRKALILAGENPFQYSPP